MASRAIHRTFQRFLRCTTVMDIHFLSSVLSLRCISPGPFVALALLHAKCMKEEMLDKRNKEGGSTVHASLSVKRRFFSSPETGLWKKPPNTECIRVWSPGARVGHAYVNVDWMKGIPEDVEASGWGKGTCSGRFGLAVADVGGGGRERRSGVRPGIRRATTLLIEREFYKSI